MIIVNPSDETPPLVVIRPHARMTIVNPSDGTPPLVVIRPHNVWAWAAIGFALLAIVFVPVLHPVTGLAGLVAVVCGVVSWWRAQALSGRDRWMAMSAVGVGGVMALVVLMPIAVSFIGARLQGRPLPAPTMKPTSPPIPTLINRANLTLLRTLTGHNTRVHSAVFSPDGKTLASGSSDKTVKLWDVQTGELKRTLTGHSEVVTSVIFLFDSKTLASRSSDGTVRLWDVQTGELMRTLTHSTGSLIAFSPDGRTLASVSEGDGSGKIGLWDVKKGKLKRTLTGRRGGVDRVAFSSDGKMLAIGSYDFVSESGKFFGVVRLWDVQTGVNKWALGTGRNANVTSVIFSPDGKTLAIGSFPGRTVGTGRVQLLDVRTREERMTLMMDEFVYVDSVAFSPDGKTLASVSNASKDNKSYGEVRLWDVQTGMLLRTLTGHDELLETAFSPDLKTLVSVGKDGMVNLWRIE